MKPILAKRDLHISHADYETIMQLKARYDEFENSGRRRETECQKKK